MGSRAAAGPGDRLLASSGAAMTSAVYQPFPMAGTARAQVWRYAPQYRRPRHFHAEPELNLVVAGTATFGAGEETVAARTGDLFWWLPGQDHELLEASDDFDLFVIGLTPEMSARALGAAGASAHCGPLVTRLSPQVTSGMLVQCAGLTTSADATAIEHRLGDLWRSAHALRRPSAEMHPLTRRAVRSLLGHPAARRVDVAVGTDPSDVSRYFHRDMKVRFATYRTRLRLLRFINEVDRGRGNLLSAARAAGFGSYSQCHRSFQKAFRCTPRDFFAGPLRDAMGDVFEPLDTCAGPIPVKSRTHGLK